MPTVLLVDSSLSMALQTLPKTRKGSGSCSTPGVKSVDQAHDCDGPPDHATKRALAVHTTYRYMDALYELTKMEPVALVVYSSTWKCTCPFTRYYDDVKSAIDQLTCEDITKLDVGIEGAIETIMNAWGNQISAKIVILTDGNLRITDELKSVLRSHSFPFPTTITMICLSSKDEFTTPQQHQKLQELMSCLDGQLILPETPPTFSLMNEIIERYISEMYQTYTGKLVCGELQSTIQLHPTPANFTRDDDFISEGYEFPTEILVIGFLYIKDLTSPPSVSRHLVLPKLEAEDGIEGETEPGKVPSFLVMLHGALKVENAVAIISLGECWFGLMMSWADSKKKSNLVLSVFKPGTDSIPWLGDLAQLGPGVNINFPGLSVSQQSGLPVPVTEKKSYSSQSISWLRESSLQSDVQKLLRYGRKLPEKTGIFYKELNKIHKASVSLGFPQLLSGLASVLERECQMLPSTASPEAAMELQHAASQLDSREIFDIHYIIMPM